MMKTFFLAGNFVSYILDFVFSFNLLKYLNKYIIFKFTIFGFGRRSNILSEARGRGVEKKIIEFFSSEIFI